MSSIVPKRKWSPKTEQITIRLPADMVEWVDRVGKAERYTRTELIQYLCDWAISAHEEEEAKAAEIEKPAKPKK